MSHFIHLYVFFCLGLFAAILLALEAGRRFGARARKPDADGAAGGTGTVDAAIFGLMGLVIAFTFSGAASRFDSRRQAIVQEANTIGTAYLRTKLLPLHSQALIQERFRQYLEGRIAVFTKLPNLAASNSELRHLDSLKQDIWRLAVSACDEARDPAMKTLVLGAVNEMFDMADLRTEQARMHPPMIINVMLVVLVIACSMLAGNVMAESKIRNWLHILVFAVSMTLTVLVIFDLEYPRIGTIRIDDWDRVLQQLRTIMA
jgi:hypothetical protein